MSANTGLILRWRNEIERKLSCIEDWSGRAQPATMLQEACRYVSQGGGKRLRGLLVCSVASDIAKRGNKGESGALSVAVALELLHAASLVHDDLPCLDNDDVRRGRASCHKAFNEATAILTGDALVGAAFMVVTGDAGLSSDTQARVTRSLAHAWWDLCLGQQLDIDEQQEKKSVDRGRMVQLKTGALFGAAVGCGAVCAGVRESILHDYVTWGTRVGECFQALDDLDDGDRLDDEQVSIERECRGVMNDMARLDKRLVEGVTRDVVTATLEIGSALGEG